MTGIAALSNGVIENIMSGEEVEKPVLQILGTKTISGGETERLRLLVSDGKYFNSFAMLATQLNHLHGEGKLEENTIIRVDKYITSVVNKTDTGKRVLIILELTVLNAGSVVGKKIGNPITYTEASSTSKRETAPPAKPSLAASSNFSKNETKSTLSNGTKKFGGSSFGGGSATKTGHNVSSFGMSETMSGMTHPIASLSPYQNKWVIKARVVGKSQLRTWSNAKGEGKLFSMDLIDETGEIRATAFREQCDKYYDMIEVDRVYLISKGQLKPANKQFCTQNNDYEMVFNADTVVQVCEDGQSDIPEIKYDLTPISQIANMETKAAVDTIGICKEAGELQTFTSRTTNKEFKKRELVLVDTSNAAVNLTLWGDEAINFDGHVQPVILVKGARINEFNGGKSLSMVNSAILKINPDVPEGHKLRGWFDNGGGESISNMLSAQTGAGSFNTDWLTFQEARLKNLGAGDRPDYFQCKAVVHIVKSQNAFYKACPQADCNKKVIDEGNGHYRCERCNAVYPDFKYRLLINMSIGDWTSNRWVTSFNEVGEQLLKRSAKDIGEALESGDQEAIEEIFSNVNFKSYIFKLRCKVEMFGDTQRNKFTVQSLAPINFKEYNKYLIRNLQELTNIKKI